MRKAYRSLSDKEIELLKLNGCKAEDWGRIKVNSGFEPSNIINVEFSGDIVIGSLKGTFERPGGIVRNSAIKDVCLHNVKVGNGVYINCVSNYIANYEISDGVYIENVDSLVCTLDSSFGIGTEVSVLNETGGREVPIYENMSAQTAYLIAMYRHEKEMVDCLTSIVKASARALIGTCGRVGRSAEIVNCGAITNVNIGESARLSGVTRLKDGTISGSDEDPVYVGHSVIAEGFVFASGSHISDGAVVHHCFVGQASNLSHLFSAHDSLFFANCNCENGESAAIFGGPYTVTMHKSSLLIAGLYSFLNAGSGSNQSNHMYKLGPIHQGVVERGSKTTSDSYILWPARIGAFSLVMGRHVNHPDTTSLPFSYLIENHNESFLVPGINLKSVGTIRDAQKWPRRDKRKDSNKLDSINFNLLSPFTVSRMMKAVDLLSALENTSGSTAERYSFQSMTIEGKALRRGRKYYKMAVDKFMGNSLISRLGDKKVETDRHLRERLVPSHPAGAGEWVDASGMFVPKSEIERISDEIKNGKIKTLDGLEKRWKKLHDEYYDMEWTWVADVFEKWWGKPLSEISIYDARAIVKQWCESVCAIDDLLIEDARKEYSMRSRIGFGIDGDERTAEGDFDNVRGVFDEDPFVKMVINHKETKSRLASKQLLLLG